ncbi:MAG: hypothetical protein CMJ83_20020 [Planctomycetes bacterium]|nr:hypothetical protein [Planctomycetota bacterium]
MMFMRRVGIPFNMRAMRGGESGMMMGVLVFRPLLKSPSGQTGLYTFEFEPFDSFAHDKITIAHDLLVKFAPILKGNLAYHPLPRAMAQCEKDKPLYARSGPPVFLPEHLYKDISYLPLHQAEGFGRLRLMDLEQRPSPRDVVIYRSLPNEMPRVAGIITGVRQTPLSHVNLRAIQDDVPNAYIEGVAGNAQITALIGKYVKYAVAADGYEIREASVAEVDAHFAQMRPAKVQVLKRDLTVKRIRPLEAIAFADAKSVGVKAANLATLRTMGLPDGTVPDGYAVPFHFYDAFMRHNDLYAVAAAMRDGPRFADDVEVRSRTLAGLRARIRKGQMPEWMTKAVEKLQASCPNGVPIRCRSSTNNEDLPGFSGAGLYDSFTHHPREGHLSKSIQQVYASLWNLRAFEEREFYRVDHATVAMGVLVHPNYAGEKANGVAVTADIVYQTDGRYYVNTQVGEDLVTNPEAESIPEELLIGRRSRRHDALVRASNRVEKGERILSDEDVGALRSALSRIRREFQTLYSPPRGKPFAMEIEFKITVEGKLAIKQARPWVY